MADEQLSWPSFRPSDLSCPDLAPKVTAPKGHGSIVTPKGHQTDLGVGSKWIHQETAGFVFGSIFQGNPFWGYPIFDNHSHFVAPFMAVAPSHPLRLFGLLLRGSFSPRVKLLAGDLWGRGSSSGAPSGAARPAARSARSGPCACWARRRRGTSFEKDARVFVGLDRGKQNKTSFEGPGMRVRNKTTLGREAIQHTRLKAL